MKTNLYIRKYGSTICVLASLVLFFLSLILNTTANDSEKVAGRFGNRIEKRTRLLDSYISEALSSDHSQWMEMDLPEDMVIYRYMYDTLQSWCNQFPVTNDNIGSRLVIQRLTGHRSNLVSPLKSVTPKIQYLNLGPKWYLVKSGTDGISCKVLAGLEIKNHLIENIHQSYNGVNRFLKLPGKYSTVPLSESGGTPVCIDGQPLFKIMPETGWETPMSNSVMRWLSLIIMLAASMLYLWYHRTPKAYLANVMILAIAAVSAYLWGFSTNSLFFSPTIYAGGTFLYSFGALMTLDISVILLIASTYLIRGKFIKWIHGGDRRKRARIYGICVAALSAAIMVYTGLTLTNLVRNSSIQMELHIWNHISIYTVIVYATYMTLLFCVLLLIQMLSPAIQMLYGKSYNVFETKSVFIFSVASAIYFTATISILGFSKEQNRVMVLSNRLAVDRDLGLEMSLRGVEDAIATDPFISALSHLERSNLMVLNRLTENYLANIAQDYDIFVDVCPSDDPEGLKKYEQKIFTGTPVAERSRFFYTYSTSGQAGYIGVFPYYSQEHGLSRIVIGIDPKANREDRGYYSLLGRYSKPGGISIPAYYSYARYVSGRLVSNKGVYAYPSVMYERLNDRIESGAPYIRLNGYIHFINRITDNETIIISRKVYGVMTYIITFSYLMLITFFTVYLLVHKRKQKAKEEVFRSNYFRSRINAVLMSSILVSLIVMSIISVTFVYRRNRTNMDNLMSERISIVQAMMDSQCKDIVSSSELSTNRFGHILESISNDTKSDITVYSPSGRVIRSTTPEIFDRMVMGSRINEDAYYHIRYRNKMFYIHSERIGKDTFYSLYAPVINERGQTIAIISVPYTDQDLDFKQDALFHAATIINIFIILILLTVLISTTFVNRMFRPLIEMGRKMSGTDLHGLEYIMYKRHDEVSTLVDAYNRMVHELSVSSRKLAQTERDKAWSEMARQVAHEIKNPLTPIKLEIQRLVRMKERNDPAWGEKFDHAVTVILEHIDILTDTANEFSTFAKLYTEEPVEVDLNRTLKDQLVIFDNRDNMEISYIGLEEATVLAPRPQLIRVFVNLITNAIQAVEEAVADGSIDGKGRIFISLRNGVRDGYYDIVFEDNGPGVKEENQARLFTPNFTTKSGGTGLGLAICRNIVDKCNGEISYQKSFSLGGACFTVSLPKKKPEEQKNTTK